MGWGCHGRSEPSVKWIWLEKEIGSADGVMDPHYGYAYPTAGAPEWPDPAPRPRPSVKCVMWM